MSFLNVRVRFKRSISLVDILLFLGLTLFVYAIIGVAHELSGAYRPKTEISLGFFDLLRYSFYSLLRVTAAYLLSLAFTFTYGYWAAKSRAAEPILISILDILQSIPVLGFMPGLVLALIHIFPNTNIGLELAAIVMIFTGEGWNMVFSFYSSVKTVPQELRDMAGVYRLNKWETLKKVEIPYAMHGLLWNSMLSMAGGWFFLMVIESFSLGNHDFRLPGIGSYMAVAYEMGDVHAIILGIIVMFVLIFVVDRCAWAPIVAWSERYRYERNPYAAPARSVVLDLLKRSNLLADLLQYNEKLVKAVQSRVEKRKKKKAQFSLWPVRIQKVLGWSRVFFVLVGIVAILWGARSLQVLLGKTDGMVWLLNLRDILLTLIRVTVAVVLGSVWTIPVGVFIGTHPTWTRRLQPVVQVVASFPAPMLFPIIIGFLSWIGVSIQFGAIVLMIFASQWYILFNVISGAALIPHHMFEVATLFRIQGREYWKAVILPAIFPSLVNGWITAAGGAWNACIVSEYVNLGNRTLVATGIGASISHSANNGDFPRLAAGIVVMVTAVVLLNRLFWGSLYKLAETRYRLEI